MVLITIDRFIETYGIYGVLGAIGSSGGVVSHVDDRISLDEYTIAVIGVFRPLIDTKPDVGSRRSIGILLNSP
jgi:hypothetical protein